LTEDLSESLIEDLSESLIEDLSESLIEDLSESIHVQPVHRKTLHMGIPDLLRRARIHI